MCSWLRYQIEPLQPYCQSLSNTFYLAPQLFLMSGGHTSITSLGMSHQTVNHSINFEDPTTGAHTQTIEGTWSQVKFMMRKRGVMNTSDDLFDTYLPEYFLWRRKFKNDDPFLKMYEHVKEQYPL